MYWINDDMYWIEEVEYSLEDKLDNWDPDNVDSQDEDTQTIGTRYYDQLLAQDIESEELEGNIKRRAHRRVNKRRPKYNITIQIDRNRSISNQLKEIYQYRCQVCDSLTEIAPNKHYVETHHLQPVSVDGPDLETNMVVVCTTCHKFLDHGSMYICPNNNRIVHFDRTHPLFNREIIFKHAITPKYLEHQKGKFVGKAE
ncbi:HNH endonuclease [Bacillus infantis]|uniref:HNH endonuclease n=1 Tax=Bacillus infantis TaxID=324767 RepID=UPI003CFA8854